MPELRTKQATSLSATLCSLLALILAMIFIPAAHAEAVHLSAVDDEMQLGGKMQYLPVPAQNSLSDVMGVSASEWLVTPSSTQSLGRDHNSVWFHLDLIGDESDKRSMVLRLDYPHYDYIDLYLVSDKKVLTSFHTGDQMNFETRPINSRTFTFPLDAIQNIGEAEIYVHIRTEGPLLIPFSLMTDAEAKIKDRNLYMSLGAYFGILGIMFAYNAFILGSLRDSAYLYYLTYMVAVAFHQATLQGIGFQFLWPTNSPIENNFAVALSTALMQATAVLFVIRFIRLYKNFGSLERVMGTCLLVYSITLVVGSPFMDYASFLAIVNVTAAISVLCGLYIGVKGWRMGVKFARLFTMAWFTYLIFIGWYLLEMASILPASSLGEHSLAFGSALELALLSIAFADRINHEKELRLRSQSRLMDVQIAMNADLEEKVRQRTNQLEEANRRLKVLSTTDGLTGLLNRRHFDECYEKAYLNACRRNETLAVLMIDIDHFKHLNDEHGHRFGDICLIQAGRLIKETVNDDQAIAARYGGEEFVVILTGATSEQARNNAEALRLAFAEHVVRDDETVKIMTVSIGLTIDQPVDRAAWKKLLQTADSLLYTAKRNGRNQVAFLKESNSSRYDYHSA